tara:strand:- start:334 stop:444 length:111 start_codon:yes stop_codon:yes gene_type:complete
VKIETIGTTNASKIQENFDGGVDIIFTPSIYNRFSF